MSEAHVPVVPPLDRAALREVNELALWAGALMLGSGAETDRIEETVHRLGTALGASWMDILVSPNAIIVTSISGEEFRTRVRRVPVLGVNMRVLDEVNALSRRIALGELDRHGAREDLVRISRLAPYNRWLVALMTGLACAAFARLFGGGPLEMLVAFVAAGLAMTVRQELARHYFNPYMVTIATAFVSSGVALVLQRALQTGSNAALLSAVLLLVPGVHLINAAEDMLKGHMVTGLTRGVIGALISACIAFGIFLAMWLLQMPVL